jgi:uncharacterized protein YndB with AHSA1/START domain
MADNSTLNAAAARTEERQADRTLVIERVFKASPEKIFRAWTDPAILVKWWGPEGFKAAPDCQMDVRVGGAWRATMVSPQGEAHVSSGVYREIAPPKRLVFTWGWEEHGKRGHETVVEISFEPARDGTRMRFVQSIFETTNSRDMHSQGWTSSFSNLERVLAG